MLSQSEADFAAEMKEKKEILDRTNAALKESGSSLAEERRRLEDARSRVREKDELEQKINNLRQATARLRAELGSMNPPPTIQKDVTVGQADKGLDLDGQLPIIAQVFPNGDADPSSVMNQDHAILLARLDKAKVMSGRSQVYQRHNQQLEQMAKTLKARSGELEERYKKIVSLCTGADEDKVDDLLDNLVQAVISEQKEMGDNSQLGRVRDFLRMVHGSAN
jgi:regulatory protein SWI6